ncbi:MAG: TolC family protein [Pseudanabaenaceae cyanobacterium]
MRPSWLWVAMAVAGSSALPPLYAQERPADRVLVVPTNPQQVTIERTQPVKLAEALALAEQNSSELLQARLNVERARASLREAEAARLPTVSTTVDYTFNDSASDRLSNVASPIPTNRGTVTQPLTGTVGINYNLFNGGSVEANVRAAENNLRLAEAELNRLTQTVRLRVVTAYYNLQNADEVVRIRQKSVENGERSLQDAQAQERAGTGTRFDVLQAEVNLANARQELLTAKANQAIARREIARQLAFPERVDFVAVDEIKPAEDWQLSLEETIVLALRNRSELDIRKLEREIARERGNVALATLAPQVSVFANYDLVDNLSVPGGIAMGYRVGARFQLNLFDGGAAFARADQNKIDRELAERRFEQDANQIRFDVEQAFLNLQARRQQIATTVKALEQANEALRLARLRFSAGVGTQLEVIRAEEQVTRADVNRLQAIIGFNQSLADLRRAVNGL